MKIFKKLNELQVQKRQYISDIEAEISSSTVWIEYFDALNLVLKEKYKIDKTPKASTIISGYKSDKVRIYCFELIGGNFKDLVRYEVGDNEVKFETLFFKDSYVSFADTEDMRKYNLAEKNLRQFFENLTNRFFSGRSDLYNAYMDTKEKYNACEKEIEDLILVKFNEDKLKKSIISKIDEYFYISSLIDIDFSISLNFDTIKYKDGKAKNIYDIYFVIAKYNLYKRMILGSFSFDIEDIENTLKFEANLVNNSKLIKKDIKGVRYLKTTLRKKLKNIIIGVNDEN